MSANTKIEWADHTFNPWIGCTKVSPGCAHCYAETRSKRTDKVEWGKGKPRKRTSDANWKLPVRWNKLAGQVGYQESLTHVQRRPRVFCASLADWLDDEVPSEWPADLRTREFPTP
jgi:protein gp37